MKLSEVIGPYRVWQRNRDAFLNHWMAESTGMLVEPVLILTALGLGLGGYVSTINGIRYIDYIAPGILASYAMFHATYECTYGSYLRLKTYHVFEAIITSPITVDDVTIGELLWGSTRSIMTTSAVLLGMILFGLLVSPTILLALPAAFLIGAMFSALSLAFAAVAPSFYTLNNFFTLFITPMFFLSGTFFPLTQLPHALQTASWILPLTSATHLMRSIATNDFNGATYLSIAIMCAYTALFLLLSLFLMRRRLVQ